MRPENSMAISIPNATRVIRATQNITLLQTDDHKKHQNKNSMN